jgi:hypothetical protein
MSGFSADWLSLREPFDDAARAAAAAALDLPARLARWRQRSAHEPFTLIDLGCGHGANLRALAPMLGGVQHWRLLDHDAQLLAAMPQALAQWAHRQGYRCTLEDGASGVGVIDIAGPGFHARVVRQQVDLARDLARLDFGAAPLITGSALLDLVSAPWLRTLVQQAQAARAALLFGLTVDGRTTWDPVDPDDLGVHQRFSQHQRRDKGFGPALGPQAAGVALQQLAGAAYDMWQTQTDWLIDGAQAPEMQRAMVDGMAAAALAQDPAARGLVRAWQARRSAGIERSRLRVGHVDILATPV